MATATNSVKITFLKGISPTYQSSKTFAEKDGVYHKVSDYAIGQTFNHVTKDIPLSHQELSDTLYKMAKAEYFHIQGQPNPGLEQRVFRRLVNFTAKPTQLLLIDLDKIQLPLEISELWKSPSDTPAVIKATLEHLGMPLLAKQNFTYVLTSSQLSRDILNCHLYFFVDEPLELPTIKNWATVINKGAGMDVIDIGIYHAVQPIYISAPDCVNFTDPFPIRIGYHEPDQGALLKVKELRKMGMVAVNMPTSMASQFDQHAQSVSDKQHRMKKNWVDSVHAFVGTKERGINKPSFRAAAQLVNDEGTRTVQDNIDSYVDTFHNEMWVAIKAHGVRGTQADLDTYDKRKVRSYIESALDKEFGKQADKMVKDVKNAIDTAVICGDPKFLMEKHILRKMRLLDTQHAQLWSGLRLKIKKAKLVPIGKIEAAMKLVGTDTPDGVILEDPNAVIRAVKSKITLIFDETDECHLYWLDKNAPLGYRIIKLLSPELNAYLHRLYSDASNVFPTSQLIGMLRMEIMVCASGKSGINMKEKMKVATQFHTDKINKVLHIRIGKYGGMDMCAKIADGKITYVSTKSTDILWSESGYRAIPYPTADQRWEKFGDATVDFKAARKYLFDTLPTLVNCHIDSIPSFITLAVMAYVRDPLTYVGVFEGAASGGKTFAANVFKQLVDPGRPDEGILDNDVNNLPRTLQGEEFYALVQGCNVIVFDNVLQLSPAKQTVFSQISTGSSMTRRILYTHTTEKVRLSCCTIFTSLGNPVTEADLAARVLPVYFDSPMKGVNEGYTEKFCEAAPFIRHCLLVVAAEYMGMVGRLSEKATRDTGVRELPLAAISTILDSEVSTAKPEGLNEDSLSGEIIKRAHTKKYGDLIDDTVLIAFIAFLDSKGVVEYSARATDRFSEFRQWARSHNGQKISAQLTLEGQTAKYEINCNMMEMPDVQRAFDMKMSSAKDIIELISQWEVYETRTRRERLKKYRHKGLNII